MTKKLTWRLKSLPTTEELRDLVKDNIVTKDEARQILFSSESEDTRDKKSLESEIQFLRELVDKLSNQQPSTIIKYIETVKPAYKTWEWYEPYKFYCTSNTDTVKLFSVSNATSSQTLASADNAVNASFTNIKTF